MTSYRIAAVAAVSSANAALSHLLSAPPADVSVPPADRESRKKNKERH